MVFADPDRTRWRRLALALLVACLPFGAMAQPTTDRPVQSPVLTLEIDRLFAESAFGRRVAAEIEAEGAAIAAENRRIEAELTEEERALTDRRAELSPEAFRPLAEAFDEKVQRLRNEQDAKARALGTRTDDARRRFLAAAQPVLEEIMRESGAAVVLERRTVFLAAGLIDITDLALRRIDAAIGDGTQAQTDDAPPATGDDTQAPAPAQP